MTSRPIPQCLTCAHWVSPFDRTDPDAQKAEPTQVCAAFRLERGGIPDDIWWNQSDHRSPHAGDGGITWEPGNGGKDEFPDWAMAGANP